MTFTCVTAVFRRLQTALSSSFLRRADVACELAEKRVAAPAAGYTGGLITTHQVRCLYVYIAGGGATLINNQRARQPARQASPCSSYLYAEIGYRT